MRLGKIITYYKSNTYIALIDRFFFCIFQYQRSDCGKVLSHFPEKCPRPDVPQLQRFVSEHHHQVLPENGHVR